MALEDGTTVLSSEGEELGRVSEVVADRGKDIFSGIAFRHGLLGTDHFAPADAVGEITPGSVKLSLSKAEAEKLDAYDG
ncbi:MAG TPA: hypothetical protein VFS18_05265 [Actinomycetota bacterium]|nr:hypothetical protein [Actinomycetota bacterium]